jgi:hypothetical protein
VVALDSEVNLGHSRVLNVKMPLAGIVAAMAALIGLIAMAMHGFNDRGLRLASELDWRFASFVFFAAAIAGPVGRMLPLDIGKQLRALRRPLVWSFCASYAVFLAALLLPNTLGGVTHADLTAGMTVFSLFGGFIVAVMAFAAGREAVALLGAQAQRALLVVAGGFFWLTYALTGLAHLSGPHRPDAFYGISLCLMILALLLRFADRLVAKLRGNEAIPNA